MRPPGLLGILKIHPSETRLTALVAGLMFCASAGGAIGSPGVEALFFARFGVQYLPVMYIVLGPVIALTSLGITALLSRVDTRRLYVLLPLIMAGMLAGARILISYRFNWFYPLLWLGMNAAWTLLNLFTWGLAGMACDTRQAKRLFPLFSAAAILGLTAGGFLTKPLVERLGTENLLLAWAGLLVLAFFLSQALARAARRPRRSPHREKLPLLDGIKQGYFFARRSDLLRWMAIAAVLFAVLYYSVVFPFSRAAAAHFPREDDLTAFLGVFQGVSTGAALLASLFLANRLYARFGFMTNILVYPLIYLLGFTLLSVAPAFTVLVGFRFLQLFWSEGVSEGANQGMYNLVPSEQREQTRAFIRGIANPAGVSLVGVLLLVSGRFLGPEWMYWTGILAAALAFTLVWQARRAYGKALVEALRLGQSNLFSGGEEPFGGFRRDAAAVKLVVGGLSSPEPAVRRVSAEILASEAAPEAVGAIVAGLDDEDPTVRAALLRALSRAGAESALLEVVSCLSDREPEVRSQAVEALGKLAGHPRGLAKFLEPVLLDPDPAVRSRAAARLLSLGPHPQAGAALREMAVQGDLPARLEALKALEIWGDASAYEIAAHGLDDPHPAIRRQAALILARIDASQCIFPLIQLLGDEDESVRSSAATALGGIGLPAVEPAAAALSRPALEGGALAALERLPVQSVLPTISNYARVKAEKALAHHGLWLASRASEDGKDGIELASEALRSRALLEAARSLKAAGLLGDREGISLAVENLESRDLDQRANALETLDSLARPGFARNLMALWETDGRAVPAPKDWLVRMMHDEDPWLRACAALAAKETEDPVARAELARLEASDPDELVRVTARTILFGGPVMKTLQTLSLMERILFLRRVPLFAGLAPTDLKQVAAIASEQLFTDGETLSHQGEPGEVMFIIVSGEVRVVKEEGGVAMQIVRRKPGEYVGEMSIISRTPRIASLLAAGEVRTLCIGQPDFEEILRLRPETSLAVMDVLCKRLKECSDTVSASIH